MGTPAQEGCSPASAHKRITMNDNRAARERIFSALRQAIECWQRQRNMQPLTRWLSRELDPRGAPIRLPISDWYSCLKILFDGTNKNSDWPSCWDDPITKLVRITFLFSRVDGTPVTHFEKQMSPKPPVWAMFDDASGSTTGRIAREFASWYAQKQKGGDNEPLALPKGSIRAYAVLRPGWPDESDFLAIDHRQAEASCRLELFAAGRSWLGPTWMVDGESGNTSLSKPPSLIKESSECLAEWSYRAGQSRITHSALVLPESKLALLSALIERRSPIASTLVLRASLPTSVTAKPIVDSRAIALTTPKKPGSAQILPIGLPSLGLSIRARSVPDARRLARLEPLFQWPARLAATLGVVGLAPPSQRSALASPFGFRKIPQRCSRPSLRCSRKLGAK